MDVNDEQLIAYLKSNGLYSTLAGAAGTVDKNVIVADVHKPAAAIGEAADEGDDKEPVEKRFADFISKVLEQDVTFAKGDASLYVSRPLTPASAARVYDWCAEQGIKNPVPPELLHVTQVHSSTAAPGLKPLDTLLDVPEKSRYLTSLGKDGKALVMMIRSPEMQARFKEAAAAGASYDFPQYVTHITLSYDASGGPDWMMIDAPEFPIQLGPEEFKANDEKWAEKNGLRKLANGDFEFVIDIEKADPDKQMIFGWASITHVNGQEIVDKQGDAIQLMDNPADGSKGLESAAYDFVLYSRTHGEMHDNIGTGKLVESIVFTPEKAALGLVAKNEKGETICGWWTGFRVDNAGTWASHKRGELPEFSIGGRATPVDM